MLDLEPPPPAWAIVLAQIVSWEDAAALMSLVEYRDTTLFANDTPITALDIGATLSERPLAGFLADVLNRRDGDGVWNYAALYSATRGLDPTREQVASFVARCRAAGVELVEHGPSAV